MHNTVVSMVNNFPTEKSKLITIKLKVIIISHKDANTEIMSVNDWELKIVKILLITLIIQKTKPITIVGHK